MLHAYPNAHAPVWIDLLDPTPDDEAEVARRHGVSLPTRAAVQEIEQSSRLREVEGALHLSAPFVARNAEGEFVSSPVGFILTPKLCLTVRFAPSGAFDKVADDLKALTAVTAADVFTRLLEEVVDRAADGLEASADVLDAASRVIFRDAETRRNGKAKATHDSAVLREAMTRIGHASEKMSRVRYTLVCIARMAQFATDRGKGWLGDDVLGRLAGVRADVASLEQYEENLLSRIQLLQDAAVAFISIEQNDVVKILTIASVAGVPPVLVVGVYGMNFKYMPELNWPWGYPFALALIVLTTVLPILWFKWKDWI